MRKREKSAASSTFAKLRIAPSWAAVALGLTMNTATISGQTTPAAALRPMASDAQPGFEVATIKPTAPNDSNQGFHLHGHRVSIENEQVTSLICFAYAIHKSQIAGAPAWFDSDRFDIDGVPDADGVPNLSQYQSMVRKVLAERFGLTFHREKRELSVYAITVAKGGPKIVKSASAPDAEPDQTGDGRGSQRYMKFTNNSMSDFALGMQFMVGKPVIDQTGLTGRYDFSLRWTPDETQIIDANTVPGMFTAIQEQLGLKLEPKKDLADVLVIEHFERASEN